MARTDQVGLDRPVSTGTNPDHVLALARRHVLRRRVKSRRSQAATEIRHTHAREHPPAKDVRRVRHRAPQDRRADPGGAQYVPDRCSPPHVDGPGGQERSPRLVAVQSEVRQIGPRIAPDEIEDPVAARVRPGGECGPCHGRLARALSSRPGRTRPAAQAIEVGQLTRGEHRLDDGRLKPVKPDHDHLLQGQVLPGPGCLGTGHSHRKQSLPCFRCVSGGLGFDHPMPPAANREVRRGRCILASCTIPRRPNPADCRSHDRPTKHHGQGAEGGNDGCHGHDRFRAEVRKDHVSCLHHSCLRANENRNEPAAGGPDRRMRWATPRARTSRWNVTRLNRELPRPEFP